MPSYSKRSAANLATCHPDLQRVFNEVIKIFDCTILQGHRGEEEQNAAYHKGLSKLKFPESEHNVEPSMAVDAVPYPIDWEDRERMSLFAGVVLGVAHGMGVALRWGGDWDRDTEVADNRFDDLPHFELI